MAEKGFTYGKDKSLNEAMMRGIHAFLDKEGITYKGVGFEQRLDFCPLIPDNFIDRDDDILCVEYTWRSGRFLDSSTRSEVAQYALTKLKNYAVSLGWAPD